MYCKFRNFCENFIFTNSAKTHVFNVKNLQQERDLPISVNNRVNSKICEDFILYAKFHKNKTLAKIFEFTVYDVSRVVEHAICDGI